MTDNAITVQATVHAPIEKVWEFYNGADHVTHWAFASDDWEAPAATGDLRVGGRFVTTMSAKDKSAIFDFGGTYTQVESNSLVEYDMDDGRHAKVTFTESEEGVLVAVTFDPEQENPLEMQKDGWQAILDNFKKYAESQVEGK